MLFRSGQWVKKSISDRKKSPNGKVMMSANYMWEIINEDDERSEFTIFVDDASFDYDLSDLEDSYDLTE